LPRDTAPVVPERK